MIPQQQHSEDEYQPVFNVPRVIVGLLAIMVVMHLVRTYLLDEGADRELILRLAFIPVYFSAEAFEAGLTWSRILSPITYASLHANWMHLLFNGFWLLAFGGVCARRLGTWRFLVLFFIGVIAGALFQAAVSGSDRLILIGASAGVSACFGAAARFALSIGGDMRQKLLSLAEVWSDRTALSFIAIWLVTNLLFGSNFLDYILPGSGGVFGSSVGKIAWQAHVGGFVAGLFSIALLDRTTRVN